MTDNIKRVTPREIIDMVMEAEVHGDTQFVLATAHDFEIQCFRARVAAHDAEILRLRARVEALEETLGLLVDHQNGCPLPSYEEKWNRAMADAKNLLGGAP